MTLVTTNSQHLSANNSQCNTKEVHKALSNYSLPSNAELQHLHAAKPIISARTSLFRLQIKSILDSVLIELDDTCTKTLQDILFKLKHVMENISEQLITVDSLQAPGLIVRNHIKRKENILYFQKPSRIDVIGSYILKRKMELRDNIISVDVAVEIPKSCFVAKDFKDYRYMDKRNMYLGVLIANIEEQCDFVGSVMLKGFRGDQDKPVAVISIAPKALKSCKIPKMELKICMIPAITTDTFQLTKLAPLKNNIRHRDDLTEEEIRHIKTPFYNNLILEDMMFRRHTRELHAAMKNSNSFAEACTLAKVWVQQRELDTQSDSLNGFLMSMMLLYLLKQDRISLQCASDHMFKILMQFIASTNVQKMPLALGPTEDGVDLTEEGAVAFCKAFDLVFLDSSGRHNLFSRITLSAWVELQREAVIALDSLQRDAVDTFQALFIQKRVFWSRFDDYYWISTASLLEMNTSKLDNAEIYKLNDIGIERYWRGCIEGLITKALGDRVEIVRSFVRKSKQWNCSDSVVRAQEVALGIKIDQQNARRILDRGPPPDDVQGCLQFRKFWKEKAELRRFKDGSIVEAVLWDSDTEFAKNNVMTSIVRYIISAHLPSIQSHSIRSASEEISGTSQINDAISQSALTNLRFAHNELCKMLRDLTSFPLKISDVIPVHASFRGTNSVPIEPHPLALSKHDKKISMPTSHVTTVIQPLNVHVRFEKSSSWPNQHEALLHCEAGFYVQISRELKAKYQLRCVEATNCLDILFMGYAFRLKIQTEKDLGILSGLSKSQKLSSQNKLAKIKRKIVYCNAHANKVDALQTKYACFGPTVRLLHHWIGIQRLSSFFCIEILELIVSHVYTRAGTASRPSSVLSGLLESFDLIASHSWDVLPLTVDLDGSVHSTKHREILKRFEASRSFPSMHPSMYIAASYEDMEFLSCWTRERPSRLIVKRFQDLARVSRKSLLQWLSSRIRGPGLEACFTSLSSDFDAVIRLNTNILPVTQVNLDGPINPFSAAVYKNLDLSTIPVMIGFDPRKSLLVDLAKRYESVALFFMNHLDKDVIYITWKPTAFLPAKFRPIASHQMIALPSTSKNFLDERLCAVPNIFQILSDIQDFGGDMITAIELCMN